MAHEVCAVVFVSHGGDATEQRYELLGASVGEDVDDSLSRARRTRHGDELSGALTWSAGIDSWLTQARARACRRRSDVYQLALARLGIESAQGIAVEDTAHGVGAAHAAGLRCIAIPNPYVAPVRVAHAELVLATAEGCALSSAIERAADGPAVGGAGCGDGSRS